MKKFLRRKTPQQPPTDASRNISFLRKMATTKELKSVLKKIEDETIPTVRNAWIDYFLERIKRPSYKKE